MLNCSDLEGRACTSSNTSHCGLDQAWRIANLLSNLHRQVLRAAFSLLQSITRAHFALLMAFQPALLMLSDFGHQCCTHQAFQSPTTFLNVSGCQFFPKQGKEAGLDSQVWCGVLQSTNEIYADLLTASNTSSQELSFLTPVSFSYFGLDPRRQARKAHSSHTPYTHIRQTQGFSPSARFSSLGYAIYRQSFGHNKRCSRRMQFLA